MCYLTPLFKSVKKHNQSSCAPLPVKWPNAMFSQFCIISHHSYICKCNKGIFPPDFCGASYNRHMLSIHHQCPFPYLSSVWSFHHKTWIYKLEIEVCPDLYYIGLGVGRMTIKSIIEFREMQKDAFSAPHRVGRHLMRISKILYQDCIYTLQV